MAGALAGARTLTFAEGRDRTGTPLLLDAMDFILKNSEIDHNGSYRFTSLDSSSSKDNSSSAGVKIAGSSATLTNNRIHHNYWHGFWCDLKGAQ